MRNSRACFTYAHYRNDTGQVFYIGKGSLKRAHEYRGHNQHWNRVAKKYGYTVKILAQWHTDQEAFTHEKLLIDCFKMLEHPLTNATDGGEGVSGWTWSESQRVKLIASLTGREGTFTGKKHSDKTLLLLRQKRLGKPSPRKGCVLSALTREKLSAQAKKQFASESVREQHRTLSKVQMRTVAAGGKTFESVHALARALEKPLSTVYRWVKHGWQDKLDAAVTQMENNRAS